jgi:hypothetical protein
MTLVIALKWLFKEGEAVLVSADSKVTMGPVSYEEKKVFPIYAGQIPIAIIGGAGSATLIKQSVRHAEKILLRSASEEWNNKTPSFEQFEETIGKIESALISRFKHLRGEQVEIEFMMVLGSVDLAGKASLYVFDNRGLAEPVHDNPGFALLGRGFFTGGNLLLRLLGYGPEESRYLELGVLSSFLIEAVSEVDSSVGSFSGDSWLMRLEKDEKGDKKIALGQLKAEALKKDKDKVKMRKDMLRRLWRLCEEKGEKAVDKGLKEIGKERKEPQNAFESDEKA